jgi:hypothetical protein
MRKTHVVDFPITGRRYNNRQLTHGFSAGWSVRRSVGWSTGCSAGWMEYRMSAGWKNTMQFFPVTHRSRISSLESLNHVELNLKPSQNSIIHTWYKL